MHQKGTGTLIDGETIPKKINQELTYRELYTSIDNLWSIPGRFFSL